MPVLLRFDMPYKNPKLLNTLHLPRKPCKKLDQISEFFVFDGC